MGKLPSQILTPSGGMNQDDSLVTPAKDAAGNSLFAVGDYRYALNARIGSSRSDHFGDLENIKDTGLVSDYNRTIGLFSNPSFNGSLSPWQQIDINTGSWLWSSDGAAINGPGCQDIMYQPIAPLTSQIVTVRYKYTTPIFNTTGFVVRLVFLNGTSVLSTQDVDTRSGSSGEFFENSLEVTLPDTCDGVGIQIEGTLVGVSIFSLYDFQVYGLEEQTITGTERVIGRLEDKEFQRLYFAVWNSEGNHSIRYYDRSTDSVNELVRWSGFNWIETTFVSMSKLDNWLALTDRRNRPRLIDVDTIGDSFASLGSNFREFHISFHKWAPNNPPVPRIYYDGVTNNFETLKNKTFQFSMRYLYKGNLKSRWSPISKGAITTRCGNFYGSSPYVITSIEVDITGSLLDDPGAAVEYNYFDHDDVKFTEAVEAIELAYREGGDQIWKKWKTVSMNVYERLQYFDGNANQTPVPVEDFIQPFDTVPFLAGTVEAVDNRFVFGDCLDELDPASITVSDVGFVTDPSSDWNDSFVASFPQFISPNGDDLRRLNSLSDLTFKYRAVIKLGIVFHDRTGWRSATYTDDTMTYTISLLTLAASYRLIGLTFKFADGVKPPEWATSFQVVRTNTLNINSFMYGLAERFVPLIDVAITTDAITGVSTDVKNRITEHFENARIVTGELDSVKTEDINFSIKLNEYLSDNPISDGIIQQIRTSDIAALLSDASRIFIDINNWYNAAHQTATKDRPLNKLFYNYRPGDRVRFLGSTVANPASASQCKIYDLPILEFTGSGIIVERPVDLLWVPILTTDHPLNDFNIEVYTPQKASDRDHTFYEMGEWYPVLYPGTEQRAFSKTDWLYTNNAAVTKSVYGPFNIYNKIPVFYGDVSDPHKAIYRSTTLGGGGYVGSVHASMSPDPDTTFDLWNNDRNIGRPSISYRDLPISKFKTTQARFGGKIVEQSSINNLNRMRDEDQFIYPSEYGRIRMLINTSNAQVESVGSILLAIGEREAWSIYVNRTTLEDLSGRSQVALSDKVLGSYNTLLGSFGTMNPESVSAVNGRVYWWDASHGSWIRYGRDGLTEISANKMRNWFRELGALLYSTYVTETPAQAIAEFDQYNEELVTFIDHSSLPETFRGYDTYKGALFSEDDKRWKGIHSYTPEMMGKVGTQLFLFKGGQIYKSEAGPGHSTFFGEKKDVKFEPVFNQEPPYVKTWMALGYASTDKWSVERILSEYRGLRTKQESRLPLDAFQDREDSYWAEIKNDINSQGGLLNGRNMKSKAIQVLFKLNPDTVTLSLLHYVYCELQDSPKTP